MLEKFKPTRRPRVEGTKGPGPSASSAKLSVIEDGESHTDAGPQLFDPAVKYLEKRPLSPLSRS